MSDGIWEVILAAIGSACLSLMVHSARYIPNAGYVIRFVCAGTLGFTAYAAAAEFMFR